MSRAHILLRATALALVAAALWPVLGSGGSAVKIEWSPLPGAQPFSPELLERLTRAYLEKGPDYRPRTHHLRPDGTPKYVNRLILESSPYLLQHAHNPVDWYPWGDEAFERARRENRPVLLSVGYSTCHWCHVMEEESFEDEEIAAYLNRNYIAIKVDREERPDVDGIYMTAVQLLTGGGGWPMTVWLTPDRKPYYGGTYFPPRDGVRGARMGFLTLLQRLKQVYDEQPDKVASTAGQIAARMRQALERPAGEGLPGEEAFAGAYAHFHRSFDRRFGGFGGAPKFPRPAELEFLLHYHRRSGKAFALEMVEKTLEAMARGGIHDHVGGGFHRYSTDTRWLVPHFEKMLYDNAQLACAYLHAFQATGKEAYATVVRDILDYVLREMTAPGGGFYSATDADSEGVEGKFFVWTPQEVRAVVPPASAELVLRYFAVTEEGNFEGKNILHTPRPLEDVARELGIAPEKARRQIAEARRLLYEARRKRIPPHTDRKILPSWNGLMIAALAQAGFVLDEARYRDAAERAADFVLTHMVRGGRLARSYAGGRLGGSGYLDDHAFFIAGLLDLFEATWEPRWLQRALDLQQVLDRHFADPAGGYFLTADDHETLLAREKPAYDGAEPAGNSVELRNLLRLHELTTDDRFRQRAEAALRAFQPVLSRAPAAVPYMLTALDFWLDRPKEILLVAPSDDRELEPFFRVLRGMFLPNRVLVAAAGGAAPAGLQRLVPWVEGKTPRGGKPTAYVCVEGVCDLPTSEPQEFRRQLAARAARG